MTTGETREGAAAGPPSFARRTPATWESEDLPTVRPVPDGSCAMDPSLRGEAVGRPWSRRATVARLRIRLAAGRPGPPEGAQEATMSPEFEIAVHWSDREPPVVSRMGADAVRDLVALLAASVPDELPGGRVVPGTDDPWSLLLGLQAFYRTVLAGDGAVALAGADGGLWTIPARQVQGVRVRMVAADGDGVAGAHVPDAFRSAFGG